MVALVGGERDLPEVLDNLVQLDLDIRESYDAALPGVTTDALRTMLKAFKEDHQKQARALAELLERRGRTLTIGLVTREIVGISAVTAAEVVGDEAILETLIRCEQDAIAAYERATGFAAQDPQVRELLQIGLDCFLRHQDSIVQMLASTAPDGSQAEP